MLICTHVFEHMFRWMVMCSDCNCGSFCFLSNELNEVFVKKREDNKNYFTSTVVGFFPVPGS